MSVALAPTQANLTPVHRGRTTRERVFPVALLLIQRPNQEEQRFPLADTEVRVGRMPENELAIDEPSISRQHVLISPSGDGHTVVDLGSRNCTWVNGQPTGDTPIPLRHGDDIDVGGQGVVLRYQSEEGPAIDASGFFGTVAQPTRVTAPRNLYEEGERWVKLFRATPWLRFAGAVIGTLAATLALIWWAIRLLSG